MSRSLRVRQPRTADIRRLHEIFDSALEPGQRRRAQAILLYAAGLSAVEIARRLEVHAHTIYADLHETGNVDEAKLESVLMDVMDLSPRGIRTHLGLNRPIYARTSAYGHFGRAPENDGGFSWERTDLAGTLKSALA